MLSNPSFLEATNAVSHFNKDPLPPCGMMKSRPMQELAPQQLEVKMSGWVKKGPYRGDRLV